MSSQDLEMRIDYLEKLNRWHMDAMNTLILMNEVYGKTEENRKPASILNSATSYLKQVQDFELILFFLVDESDSSFKLKHSYQKTDKKIDIEGFKKSLIDNGEFAWAISQNHTIETDCQFNGRKMLMHVLTTKNRVRGMFVGFSRDNLLVSIATQNLISVILQNTAYALESSALYSMINKKNHQLKVANQSLEQKVAEKTEDLQMALVRTKEATKSKSQFLANMSHEIRTPMNAITGFAHLLMQEELSGNQQMHVKQIDTASRQLLNLINDILDLSKVEAKKLKIETIRFNLLHLLDELNMVMKFVASENSVPLKFNVQQHTSHHLEGDAHRLKQILTNLLSNAIKFSENNEVVLSVSESFDNEKEVLFLEFSITDHGIGMTDSQIQGLFLSFSQVDSSRTRKYRGTGLGLAISQQLTHLMGGKITVISEYGKGSTFTVRLPFIRTSSQDVKNITDRDAEVSLEEKLSQLAGKHILLVEDNLVNQMVATGILKQFGFLITLASDGVAAVEAVKEKDFDLIFMDLHMPKMDGYEASTAIRTLYSENELPIIALTADAFKEIEQSCIECKMNDYLSKPIDIKKLKKTLIKWLH